MKIDIANLDILVIHFYIAKQLCELKDCFLKFKLFVVYRCLFWQRYSVGDVHELRRVVVEVADSDNHRDGFSLPALQYRAGNLKMVLFL